MACSGGLCPSRGPAAPCGPASPYRRQRQLAGLPARRKRDNAMSRKTIQTGLERASHLGGRSWVPSTQDRCTDIVRSGISAAHRLMTCSFLLNGGFTPLCTEPRFSTATIYPCWPLVADILEALPECARCVRCTWLKEFLCAMHIGWPTRNSAGARLAVCERRKPGDYAGCPACGSTRGMGIRAAKLYSGSQDDRIYAARSSHRRRHPGEQRSRGCGWWRTAGKSSIDRGGRAKCRRSPGPRPARRG